MYSIEIHVKNKENPYYKELLDRKTKDLFGFLNDMFDKKASLGMKEEFGEQTGPFCVISGISENSTLNIVHKVLSLFGTELNKKYGITEITYKILITEKEKETPEITFSNN